GIPHMLVGSHASSYYGEPRSTHDIDLVVDLSATMIDAFLMALDTNRYYLSESALREGRMANVIDIQTGDKLDLFFLESTAQAKGAFARRRPAKVMGCKIDILSPEDAIASKLRWDAQLGGSERQRADILSMMRIQQAHLDVALLDKLAVECDCNPLWSQLKSMAWHHDA
ncbi:MAG: hypothetical protein AAGD07_19335, partial [Planctomycetota bacterium]